MIENFGRVVHSKLTDLRPEEEDFLNQYNQISFESMNHKFNTQLHYMKNKIGVFRDPIYPQSYPWIIPEFTFIGERASDYTKPNVFTINQRFHRGKPLDNRDYNDEMQFWQYKHYEKFHVNDPTVTWGPNDIGMTNLVVDDTHKKICFVDNEGFRQFKFTQRDHFEYRVMSVINPHIGEYLSGKNCDTPYETIKDDWNKHDEVKVFFRRLFLYQKLMFNFQFIDILDEKALSMVNGFRFNHLIRYNWFYHEGKKVMQLTDDYVISKNRLSVIDRKKYSNLFRDISIK
tara:strand:- start:77 stop:937 length:861 start_codon:yes stop_codon:yes gene_type:complete